MTPPAEPHGILSHYFAPPRAQGALTLDEWQRGLDAYRDRLIPAADWIAHAIAGTLTDECCVTLDDGLAEQWPALKILERRGLTAAINVYTQPLVGVPHSLETFRWIRNQFATMEDFYSAWIGVLQHEEEYFGRHFAFVTSRFGRPDDYLADYTYLSWSDREFRYWRNEVADPAEYERVMDFIARANGLACPITTSHWLSAGDLRALRAAGHVIGLHTHTHPTGMHRLSREQQAVEYATSKFILERSLGEPVATVSSPCGSVTDCGHEWMRNHGITLAWAATMAGRLPYEAPRWSTGHWQ